ncbi:MAG: Icc protein [Porticoccus sp.]|jgi:Icc protein
MVRLVQITDCHLGAEKNFISHGVNTYESFSKVLHEIATKLPPSLIIASGDISSSGEERSYQLFSDAMESSLIPYRWLPGNHDDFLMMNNIIVQPFVRVEKQENWAVISLVSADPGSVAGVLAQNEIEQLRGLLKNCQNYFVLLFVHHHPVSINSRWLDEHCISNNRQFEEILAQYDNVRGIFTGHVHQERVTNWNELLVYNTPSTCFQFVSDAERFQLNEKAPGYRWIELHPDGFFDTGVNYLET